MATSVCQTNFDLVNENWLRRLSTLGVHYAWFYTYRPIGPKPCPELALTPEQVLQAGGSSSRCGPSCRSGLVDAYWDDQGQALCPMVTGVSHHIGPSGAIEPCPIIQFAKESIHDGRPLYDLFDGLAVPERFPQDVGRGYAGVRRPGAARPGQATCGKARCGRHDAARHGPGGDRGLDAAQQPALPGQRDPGRTLGIPLREETLVLWIWRVQLMAAPAAGIARIP